MSKGAFVCKSKYYCKSSCAKSFKRMYVLMTLTTHTLKEFEVAFMANFQPGSERTSIDTKLNYLAVKRV